VPGASNTTQPFRSLFDSHHKAIHAYCLRRLPVEDANEAASEVFLVALRKAEKIPADDEALLWLYGVARNVVRNWQRSGRRRLRLVAKNGSLAQPDAESPEMQVVRAEEHEEVLAAIDTLRRDDQELVRLKVWEGLSNDAVAAILGISPRAVEGRYTRAIKKLSKILKSGTDAATSSPFSTERGEAAL